MQARWLENLADAEHGGNVSAAARKALADCWMMRRAREEYENMRKYEGVLVPGQRGRVIAEHRVLPLVVRREVGVPL